MAEQRTADVVVVGGGVAGCSAAWFLAREGLDVLLVERDALAAHASGAAAGMLTPTAEGLPGSTLLRAGRAALAQLEPLCAELQARSGIDPEFEASGLLRIALSDEEQHRLESRCRALREAEVEWLDAASARFLQPGLAPELRGASWSREEAHVRSPLLTRAYAGAAQSLGARIRTGTAVTGLTLAGDRVTGVELAGALQGRVSAGCVVVCAGTWSGALEAWLGALLAELPAVEFPAVEPIRGQILALREVAPPLRTMVWGEGAYLVPKRDGSVIVGATEERAGFEARVTARGMAQLLEAAPRLVPALADAAFDRGWAGLRPGSPDGLPSIGRLAGVEQLVVAYGHYRSGVLLSPISGQLVCALVAGKDPGAEAIAFDPARAAVKPAASPGAS